MEYEGPHYYGHKSPILGQMYPVRANPSFLSLSSILMLSSHQRIGVLSDFLPLG
jgi:hypothetical protein